MAMATETEPASRPARRSKVAAATATEMGRHLDLSRQRIVALADEGVIPREADGTFPVDACRIGYLRWLRDPARRSAKSAADGKFVEAKTRLLEIRTMEKLGQLVPAELLDEMVDLITGLYRSELNTLPAQFTRDIRERRRLEDLIRKMLHRIANEAGRRAGRIQAALDNGRAEAHGTEVATDDDA